ncbi:hypothetical protein ACWC5I_28565 [Kitasatospora sp. NPDC001574]
MSVIVGPANWQRTFEGASTSWRACRATSSTGGRASSRITGSR